MPFSLQEMLSSAPHPTPLRQEPKAPCFSEPACGSRPPGSDPRLGLGTDRAERGGSRQGVRPGTPLLPPALSPPSAAPPPPPPAGAGPEPPRQPASERSALGWDSEEAAKEETAAAPRASSSAPTSDSRGEPWLSERRGGQRRRAGSLRPCLASQAPAVAAGERGALSPGPCLAPQPRGADRQTDRQSLGTHARGRAQRPAPRPVCPRAVPPVGRPLPPWAPGSRPLGAEGEREGGAAGPPGRGQLGRPGRASSASSLSPAQRVAAIPQRPVGALCPAAGPPRPGLHRPRERETC
ncbi:translation initiation factor IF-2-like [Orcinus orca]|uniref:translation initiation factor IF-2-like n=1 Tax=Orcinus orca TaxID=9733 RepID=UPI002112B5A1|nr:translation initiation factor IF-2-like [Orcinus orca]